MWYVCMYVCMHDEIFIEDQFWMKKQKMMIAQLITIGSFINNINIMFNLCLIYHLQPHSTSILALLLFLSQSVIRLPTSQASVCDPLL